MMQVIEQIRSGRHKANSSIYQLLNPNADAKSKKDVMKGLGELSSLLDARQSDTECCWHSHNASHGRSSTSKASAARIAVRVFAVSRH